MQTLTQQLIAIGLHDRILTDDQLRRLVAGTDQRRHHLVSRAVKAGELVRLRRGLYVLADEFREHPSHPFTVAQMLVPGSYVSLETALAFHGWIPEAVYTTASIVPGRKVKEFRHEQFGLFTFHPLAIRRGYFLELVRRVEASGQSFLVAQPLRALLDLVCLQKIEWQGFAWLEHGLRVDVDALNKVTGAELRTLKDVYKHQRMRKFIAELEQSLGLVVSHD
ncbi:MAG: type IV toxin-antitoxin system AbiEi family antitoxin domain-containing protein [Proteobacteria bacterium]|nr:type IV toxin-antitoxin system AbiEi family antitoxin domain-containing protein [Pseudomonadota bacterium]